MGDDRPKPLAPPNAKLPTYRTPEERRAFQSGFAERVDAASRLVSRNRLDAISGVTLTDDERRSIREWVARSDYWRRQPPSLDRTIALGELDEQLDAMHYRGEAPRFELWLTAVENDCWPVDGVIDERG